jgi:hypothetical protein
MNHKLNVGLSLAAGLLGGFLSHYSVLRSVHAQAPIPAATEIKAQRFVLVNATGAPAGVFGFDETGNPNVVLFDKTGKVIWSADGRAKAKPLTINTAK